MSIEFTEEIICTGATNQTEKIEIHSIDKLIFYARDKEIKSNGVCVLKCINCALYAIGTTDTTSASKHKNALAEWKNSHEQNNVFAPSHKFKKKKHKRIGCHRRMHRNSHMVVGTTYALHFLCSDFRAAQINENWLTLPATTKQITSEQQVAVEANWTMTGIFNWQFRFGRITTFYFCISIRFEFFHRFGIYEQWTEY